MTKNNENLIIPLQNNENHENVIIPCHNNENEIHRITCQNHENHTKLKYSMSES